MSDSETENAFARPTDTIIERKLREHTVALLNKEGTSINSIRTAAEKVLNLPAGFFKDNATWKAKSKAVVNDQLEKGEELPPSPEKSSPVRALKRASPGDDDVAPPKKKRKGPTRVDSDDDDEELSELEDTSDEEPKPKKAATKSKPARPTAQKPVPKPQKKQSRTTLLKSEEQSEGRGPREPGTEESTPLSSAPEDLEEVDVKPRVSDSKAADADSESDLSSVIDDEPKPKKRRKGPESQSSQAKRQGPSIRGKDADLNPDEAEIKRLQGWLVKCGIRKVWGKELKPYETPKAKIKHLKEMLEDAGMTGRFSLEKANQIKEARELAADIEAVKEGNERWGMENDSEEVDAKPRKRLVRGQKNFDFLSSGGEETD